jgi:hypothetical protein
LLVLSTLVVSPLSFPKDFGSRSTNLKNSYLKLEASFKGVVALSAQEDGSKDKK